MLGYCPFSLSQSMNQIPYASTRQIDRKTTQLVCLRVSYSACLVTPRPTL